MAVLFLFRLPAPAEPLFAAPALAPIAFPAVHASLDRMVPTPLRRLGSGLLMIFAASALSAAIRPGDIALPAFHTRADTPPRKIVVASAVADFSGTLDARLALLRRLAADAARQTAAAYPGRGLDLLVFPEFALGNGNPTAAAERAVSLSGSVLDTLTATARSLHSWLIVPLTLREDGAGDRFSNAAVLLDRAGAVAGIFRKVHPVADPGGGFEGGVTPGAAYPVFTCDFGRVGILICWDMSYEEAWTALADGGADLVALCSASPQTLRPAAAALRHHYYVVNSAPREDASIFDPIGRTLAQQTTAPGLVLRQIDLSYAILHWSETLHEGRAFTDRYGARAGGDYSAREDTGVFWSNDPALPVGTMVRELGLHEMPDEIARIERARQAAAEAPASAR